MHPHDSTGQVLYTQAIIRSLPALAIANATPTPHVSNLALDPANWERATLVPITAAKLSAGLLAGGHEDRRITPRPGRIACRRWSS